MIELLLSDFRLLITHMPTRYQSFTAKRVTKNWEFILQRQDRVGDAMRQIFGDRPSVDVCRADIRAMEEQEGEIADDKVLALGREQLGATRYRYFFRSRLHYCVQPLQMEVAVRCRLETREAGEEE